MAGELAKVNQCKLSAHGKDSFDDRIWNSLSWGAEKSMISTKLYNKTLEMKEVTKTLHHSGVVFIRFNCRHG